MKTIEIIFWIFLFMVFYTYVGYGILLFILLKIKRVIKKKENVEAVVDYPEMTLVIAAYNEEAVVADKMENCNQLIYPNGKLKICWITDGTNDRTNELLAGYPDVEVLYQPERKGKTAALNRGINYIKTPVTVFTDANTMLNPEAMLEIAKCFSNDEVGCVAGEKRVTTGKVSDATAGEGIYWKYESTLKSWDDEFFTAVGAAGELFAIRTKLFEKMPDDTLLDDFILSMRIAQKGYKIAYCKKAFAIEPPSSDILEEEKRKIRISAGGLQSVYRLRALLNPFKYTTLCFQYVSHRVLRWTITPFLLFALLPINFILVFSDNAGFIYPIVLLLQLMFYMSALFGYVFARKKIKHKAFYIPFYFLFMNISVFKGIRYLIRKKGSGVWEKAKRAA